MNHATVVQRLAFAQVLTLITVAVACAQQQPRVAQATMPHAYACYQLSYKPDSVGYYLPALVQLVDDGLTLESRPYQLARWRGGDVQRQSLRDGFKLSSGSANWRQWDDSLLITSHTGMPQMSIHLRRVGTAASAASNARADGIVWSGRAVAYPDDVSDRVEGDVSAVTASCDTFHTGR